MYFVTLRFHDILQYFITDWDGTQCVLPFTKVFRMYHYYHKSCLVCIVCSCWCLVTHFSCHFSGTALLSTIERYQYMAHIYIPCNRSIKPTLNHMYISWIYCTDEWPPDAVPRYCRTDKKEISLCLLYRIEMAAYHHVPMHSLSPTTNSGKGKHFMSLSPDPKYHMIWFVSLFWSYIARYSSGTCRDM